MKVTKLGAKGFSLVELMVVVAIIGILAAVAIPQYQNFQSKARMTEGQSMLGALYGAHAAYHGQWSQYFADFRDIGYAPRGRINYNIANAAGGMNAPGDSNYPGPTVPGGGPTVVTTVGGMGGQVTEIPNRADICVPAGMVATTANTFVSAAAGNIDSGAACDVWTINQDKTFAHTSNDLDPAVN